MSMLRLLSEGGEVPNTELVWLLMIVFGFFLLVVVVGWWVSSRKQDQPEVKQEAVKSSKKKEVDDLVKIEGIGPKVAKVLKDSGITTFDELAHAKAADVQKILDDAGLQMMNPEGWIEQAKLAAKGEWDAFAKLQEELKGGRKK
ncbi:MAG: DUF4332 domain-containing protein [Anaerolineales bacterium]